MMPQAYLGLGSNLGDRVTHLRDALRLLGNYVHIEVVSSLYETPPFGVTEQPPFYNAVCRVTTELDPTELLRQIKRIEHDIGRRPGPRWGPRPADIDILLYDSLVMATEELTIPHVGLPERAFVLIPLAEIAPDLVHPLLGLTVSDLLANVDRSDVTTVQGPDWAERSSA